MSVYKRRGSWFCDITIDGRRVQRVLKKARTRAQAIKAESVIQNKLFENKYKVEKRPEVRFDKFVKDHFLPYSELHKRTCPRRSSLQHAFRDLRKDEYFGNQSADDREVQAEATRRRDHVQAQA